MSPYREPFLAVAEIRGKMLDKFMEFVVWLMPLWFVLFVVGLFASLFYALWHESHAQRMHQDHAAYVLNQDICDVHHGWYTPSENIGELVACRRLSDHGQFYVQRSGREMAPVE